MRAKLESSVVNPVGSVGDATGVAAVTRKNDWMYGWYQ